MRRFVVSGQRPHERTQQNAVFRRTRPCHRLGRATAGKHRQEDDSADPHADVEHLNRLGALRFTTPSESGI